MIRIFTGYDPREAIGSAVFAQSVLEHATRPFSITPLHFPTVEGGSNAFTYTRFMVPALCEFEGFAIYADGADMLMQADVAELALMFDTARAVQVVKHPRYTTRHPVKYRGSRMQCPNRDYARKNWASLMLINCEHQIWRDFANWPMRVEMLQLSMFSESEIGELPARWNVLADEGQPIDGAAVLHYTAGIPAIPAYRDSPGALEWFATRDRMLEVP